MPRTAPTILVWSAVVGLLAPCGAAADVIGPGEFASPTIIDFSDAPPTSIGAFYSSLGVTFSHLCGGSATGSGQTGTNFTAGATPADTRCEGPNGTDFWPDVEAAFSSPVDRAGFLASTNENDDTFVSAFLGATLVGTEFFATGDAFVFAGIQFLSPFDRLVIDFAGPTGGAGVIDDFRFDTASVPEPGTSMLIGAAAAGVIRTVRRRRKQARGRR